MWKSWQVTDGPDTTAKGRKESVQAEWGQILQIYSTKSQFLPAKGSMPMSTKSFEIAYGPSGPRGCTLKENMSSGGFSAHPYCQDHTVVLGWILDFGRSAAIFAGLEPTGLLSLEHFDTEVLAMPHANLVSLCSSIGAERDQLSTEYIQKTCRSFHCCW
jgi:hypothetical protein